MNTRTWLENLPKVELHIHLEGSIPLDALWTLVEKYGGDPATPTLEALRQRFVYRDFPHFIQTWVWKNGFLRQYEDFTVIAEAVARDLARQNMRYAEIFYSPPDFARHGLELQPLTEAIRRGLTRVPEIEINLVADLVRDFGPEQAARTLAMVSEVKDQGVIGVGIGGSEQNHPPEPFAPVFAEARRRGFRTSAHAGEAAGAASIWGALRALEVDRIGHATRAVEDAALLAELARRRVPLELCPISNVCLSIVPDMAAHPARRYVDMGMLVSINTDDPAMFGNSLADEYEALMTHFAFTQDEIRALVLAAIESAWLPEERKRALAASFQADSAW
ncbi:MAG: adenosine deaminase [Chloroflexaceae bacterium]|jgi:adenosine deaminase|nr:adenosine deaminase [Chloroflexaceae bacterium]